MADSKLSVKLNEAWTHRVKHHHKEAETVFREVLTNYPDHVEALYGLAQALMEQGKDKDAIKSFKQAAKLLQDGALGDDELRASLLRRQALGHIERLTKGSWDLISIGNAIPK